MHKSPTLITAYISLTHIIHYGFLSLLLYPALRYYVSH